MKKMILLILLSAGMLGCSSQCDQEKIVGTYRLHLGEDQYELRLAKNGTGELLRNKAQLGILKWAIEPSTDQVFLEVPTDALSALHKLSSNKPPPRNAAHTQSGYFGVTPQCRSRKPAARLDLDVDGQAFFQRVGD